MNRTLTLTSAVVVAALSLAAMPADAQGRRDNGRQRDGRAAASQPARQGGGRQDGARAVPRDGRREAGPQARGVGSGSSDSRRYSPSPRGYDNPQYRQRAVPRLYDRPSYQSPSRRYNDRPSYQSPSRRYDDRRGYAVPRGNRSYSFALVLLGAATYDSPRYVRPYNYVPYRPYYFSRPYYSFRPRLNIGFGLWLGYAVPYPYTYMGDYRPRVYGYYDQGAGYGVSVYGGVSFDIQPSDADLFFVDGEYVGRVGAFTPNGEPLTLTPGQHQISVQCDGFRPMEWDVTIEPGQVIPYRGAMEQYEVLRCTTGLEVGCAADLRSSRSFDSSGARCPCRSCRPSSRT